MSAGKWSGHGLNVPGTSRRSFLRWCAAASGALTPVVARGLRGSPEALAQTAPKRGGTLRVGFYIEAATMDPHLSGSKIDRQVYHNLYDPLLVLDVKLGLQPGLAESWTQPDPKTLVFKLQRGVKFHDGTDFNAEAAKFNFNRMKTDPKSVRKGETANIDIGRRGRLPHHPAEPQAAGRIAPGRAHRSRGHDGVPEGRPGARPGPRAERPGRRHGALRVRRVGEGRPHPAEAQRQLLEQAGGPVPRPDPLPPDPGRHREAGEPPVGRDRRHGLRPAARRGSGQGRQEPGRSRRSVACAVRVRAEPHEAAVQQQGPAPGRDLRRSTSSRSSRGSGSASACRRTGPIPPSSWAYDSSIAPEKRDLAKVKAKLAEGGQLERFHLHASRRTTSRSTSRKRR